MIRMCFYFKYLQHSSIDLLNDYAKMRISIIPLPALLFSNCDLFLIYLYSDFQTNGEPKKSSYKGSWQALLEACSKSISELVNIAGKRRRNVIIDQNNVFSAVQIRKISNFGEFVRKAIVIVPSEEEWNNRKAAKGQFITEEVTESEMLTMKGMS